MQANKKTDRRVYFLDVHHLELSHTPGGKGPWDGHFGRQVTVPCKVKRHLATGPTQPGEGGYTRTHFAKLRIVN